MGNEGSVLIVRRRRQFTYFLAAYDVLVDGTRRASLQSGKTVRLRVSPGRHVVQTAIDTQTSMPISVDVRAGEVAVLETGAPPLNLAMHLLPIPPDGSPSRLELRLARE
jgi:hypothetical protein